MLSSVMSAYAEPIDIKNIDVTIERQSTTLIKLFPILEFNLILFTPLVILNAGLKMRCDFKTDILSDVCRSTEVSVQIRPKDIRFWVFRINLKTDILPIIFIIKFHQ